MKANGKSFARVVVVFIAMLLTAMPTVIFAASMNDYCIQPPYVKTNADPNVMIIMDNALDMGEPAYTGDYNPATSYDGYFKPTLKYIYSAGKFIPSSSGIYSGNLLNWATTSRYDLLEKILVGGISASRQSNINTLISKSNSWTKTLIYPDSFGLIRSCVFKINNANLEITETSGGACGYLDIPTAHPIPTDPLFSFMQPTKSRLADYAFSGQSNDRRDSGMLSGLTPMSSGRSMISRIWSAISDFLIPEAEAASQLKISGGPSSLFNGTECTPYSISISAAGGSNAGYQWSWVATSPSTTTPPGLTLGATGTPATTISGTPTTSGTYYFTVTVRDDAGHTDTKNYSIAVLDATVTIDPSLSSPLQDGTVGSYYLIYNDHAATSVCGNYTWSVSAGSLPPGIFIWSNTTGALEIWGSDPTTSGTYNFTLQVTDGANNSATKPFTLTINPAPSGLQITTTSPLTGGKVGQYQLNYFFSNCGAGGLSWPFSWSVTSGSLPPGMFFSYWDGGLSGSCPSYSSYAYIYGVPTQAGTYNFIVEVMDGPPGHIHVASKAFQITIAPNPNPIRTTGNLTVAICAGDYSINCTSVGYNGGSGALKSGLIDEYWSQARFGLITFGHNAEPDINEYVKAPTSSTPDSNFLTDVENAVAIDNTTKLVDAEYKAIDYYQTNANNNQNPFEGAVKCTKSFVLMITAGAGANAGTDAFSSGIPDVCTSATLTNLSDNSCYGFNHNDLRPDPPPIDSLHLAGRQYVSTYIVNTMGTPAAAGYDSNTNPATTGDILKQTALKGGGKYYEVKDIDADKLKTTLQEALLDIIKRAAAGTAASVLASGEGSGANLIQAVFYPRRQFGNDEIDWIGRLTNLWYYVDPNLNNSSIREDAGRLISGSTYTVGDKVLTLKTEPTGTHNDHVVQLFFDSTNQVTKAHRWEDTNGDSIIDAQLPDVPFESIGNLWEAGKLLWGRTTGRNIYTQTTGTRIDFSIANRSSLRSYLTASTDAEAEAIIRYMHGEDNPSVAGWSGTFRSRSVSIDGVGPYTWKLADVLNSTPKISSWLPLNKYHKMYNDGTYGVPGQDPSLLNAADDSRYITSTGYRGRDLIYTGANDGMLHAFKLGTLELHWSGMGDFDKARLTGTGLGEEAWAFIPENALPYLKYTADPAYCHVYTIDLTPFILDASIGAPGSGDVSDTVRTVSHWRTILIGGMRYGGACKNMGTACAGGGTDCVKTPMDGVGYSSYFALDITDQNNPTVLWEFSHDDLGFSTSGPSVVRISVKDGDVPNRDKNGKWFVVIGSGPTGPIDTTSRQFLGRSDQNLRLFILDLKGPGAGAWTENTNFWIKDTTIPRAFAGSMLNSTVDTDMDYQDDVMYIPYVKESGGTWTDGGVLRLSTNEDTNPGNWAYSTLIDGIGPVTSAVAKLQNNTTHALWVFFGTGRYYYQLNGAPDDAAGQRQLYGIKDPCFGTNGFDGTCRAAVLSGLDNRTTVDPLNPPAESSIGWFINLDADQRNNLSTVDTSVRAERVITDPVAASSGIVYFTTFKPYTDECALGGKSFIWAVRHNSGGDASALLKGQALIQVSTGSIEQLNLSNAFTERNQRRTGGIEGVPPTAQGLSIISSPPPVKRVMHVKER